MVVREITQFKDFLALQQEWNALLEKSEFDTIFLRHDWFKCWWEAFGKGKDLFILLVSEKEGNEDDLIGICPLMISQDQFRGFPVRKLGFIENDESLQANIICGKKSEEVIHAMMKHLFSKPYLWDVLAFNRIPLNTNTHNLLVTVCRRLGLDYVSKNCLHSPLLTIDTDWDTFYKNTSQRFKKRLRYNSNQLQKLGDVSYAQFTRPVEVEGALRSVFAIGESCWKMKIKKSISSTEEKRDFFAKLTAVASAQGWLFIWLLRNNEKPIAYEYHLRYKNKVHALRSEFDDKYADFSPGAVLESHVVKNLFASGVKDYDMGGSDDNYKKHWTSSVVSHVNLFAFNRGLYPRFLHFIESRAIPLAKNFKSALLYQGQESKEGLPNGSKDE